MICAVVQNELIRPLDPLPDAWVEGHQVIVEDSDDTPGEAEDVVSRASDIRPRSL